MSDNQVSDVSAQALPPREPTSWFTPMGDADMYWSAAMADNQNTRLVHKTHYLTT